MINISSNCFKVDKPNYVALTEGFSVNGNRFNQSIWCDVEVKPFPMLLTIQKCKARKSYVLNSNCKSYDLTRYFTAFNDFSRPIEYKYIAEYVNQYHIENDMRLWETICNNGLFDIWDPIAPFRRFDTCKSHPSSFRIILIRVYEIEIPIHTSIINRDLRLTDRIFDYSKLSVTTKRPIISDTDFQVLKEKLENSIYNFRTDINDRNNVWF